MPIFPLFHSRRCVVCACLRSEQKVVIVSGLPTSVDEKALEKVLRKYGPITSITYPLGKENTVIGKLNRHPQPPPRILTIGFSWHCLLTFFFLLLFLPLTAHVEFKDAKFAERASKKCVNVPLGDRTISASFKPEKRDGRLIIRNLPFQVHSLSSRPLHPPQLKLTHVIDAHIMGLAIFVARRPPKPI